MDKLLEMSTKELSWLELIQRLCRKQMSQKEAADVALDIARIPDPRTRQQVAEAVRVLLKKYFS